MKKTIVLSVVAVLLLVAGLLFFLTRPLGLSLERIFPADALMYARLSHITEDAQKVSQSLFWKNISSIDLPKVLEHNGVALRDVEKLRKMQKDLDLILKSPITQRLVGKEVALGIYSKKSPKSKEALKAYDVLFATRLAATAQMSELVISLGHQWSDDITTTPEVYRGYKILHVHFSKRKLDLQYTRIRDVLFVAWSPTDILQQIINVYEHKQPSLFQDPDFAKIMTSAYPKGHALFYINANKFYEIFKKHLPENQKKYFDQMSKSNQGFKSTMISFLPGEISKMKMILGFDGGEVGSYWKSLLSCKSSINASLKFVPHNVMAYHWGACVDFNNLYNQMLQTGQGSEESIKLINTVEKQMDKRFHLSIQKDILPSLGSEVGGYLSDIDIQGMFPYPRGVMFIKIKDRALAQKVIDQLTLNPIIPLKEEEYQKSLIHYVNVPMGVNMDPGYVFVDDYLLLASSQQLLKASVDAYHNPNQALSSSESLKQFNLDTAQSQGMSLWKIDDMANRMQQLLNWSNKMISSQITAGLTYRKQVASRQKELEDSFALKKDELIIAQNKLKSLESKQVAAEATPEEIANNQENLDHLAADVKSLQEEVGSYRVQREELKEADQKFQLQSESFKLWLFNSDEVLMPLLKGFEGMQAVGSNMRVHDQLSETEILIK